MKQIRIFVVLLFVFGLLTACGGPGSEGEPQPNPDLLATCTDPAAIISIPDTALEALIRGELAQPAGGVTCTDMKMLTSIRMKSFSSGVKKLDGLQHAVNLEQLELYGGTVSNLEPLRDLHKLTIVLLADQELSTIEVLSSLPNLISLDVSRNNISDISAISKLVNLESLSINWNPVRNLEPLRELRNLTSVRLAGQELSDVADLLTRFPNFANLETLGLADNGISDITPLTVVTSLTTLELGNNLIQDLGALEELDQLSELFLPDNLISSLDPLASLTNLSWLSLTNNQITDISALSGLPGLFLVYLNNNRITDLVPLVANTGWEQADATVFLEHNCLDLAASSENMVQIRDLESRGVRVSYEPQDDCL